MRDPYLIKSVAHAAQLLDAFAQPGEILAQHQMVTRTGLSRGIIHRLVYTLKQHGVMEQVGENQYRLQYRKLTKNKWKIGYGAPGIDTLFTRAVTESLRVAADAGNEIELLVLDHHYKSAVTLRNAEQFIRERVDLVIEYQVDVQLAAVIANRYQEMHIPVVAVNNPHPGATYFGADNYEAGLVGGRHLGNWARTHWQGEVDQIVMLELARAGAVPKSRLGGMVHGIQGALGSGADKVPVVYLNGNGQFEASWRAIRNHLRTTRAERVLIGAMNDNSALGALRAYDEAGRLDNCAVMGQNGSPEAREELRRPRSRLVASVAYFPETYGPGLVRLALDILNRRFVPPSACLPDTSY